MGTRADEEAFRFRPFIFGTTLLAAHGFRSRPMCLLITISPGRPSVPVLLAILLIGGGGFALLRNDSPGPGPRCDPATDPDCVVTDPRTGPSSRSPAVLSADEACRDAAYLCAELATTDRVRIQRWRDHTGPIVVHVPTPDIEDRALALRLQRAAGAGIRLWNGQPFPIVVDERGTREAHVTVEWMEGVGGTNLGVARVAWSPTSGLRVRSLELATQNPYYGRPMDLAQLRLTAMHEMGHALGLPHSDQPRDVMYPTNTATSLSTRDYRALEALYALEDGTEIVR
jgi:hypothetical protein